jgi:hypothetical protein
LTSQENEVAINICREDRKSEQKACVLLRGEKRGWKKQGQYHHKPWESGAHLKFPTAVTHVATLRTTLEGALSLVAVHRFQNFHFAANCQSLIVVCAE